MFRMKFNIELCNRFKALEVEDDINNDFTQMENIYKETADKVLCQEKIKTRNG